MEAMETGPEYGPHSIFRGFACRITSSEPRPGRSHRPCRRAEILRALLVANGGKMLEKGYKAVSS